MFHDKNKEQAGPRFDRGFTGHEHLSRFGLVNMDGRMYDPFTASFLSADRFVQDPSSAQGFNRYAYCMHTPLRYVDPTGWFMGPPRSKTDMIQEYLSDPCPITRQDLLEAGMYNIEGGYGWYGGEGSMSAGWMESDGSVHTSQWDIFTSEGGFDAGAWAISASFHPMWMNECRGLLCYEYRNPVNTNSFNSVNTNLNVGGGHGGGNGGGLRSQNCPMIKNTNTLLGYVVSTESTLFGARAHGLDTLKNSKALDELGKSLRASYESRGVIPKGLSGKEVGNKIAVRLSKTSDVFGYVGFAIVGVDIALNDGIILPSHVLDASVGAVCIITGPSGWIIGASYLTVDIGSYAFTNQSFGQHLNDWCGGYGFDLKTGKITPN